MNNRPHIWIQRRSFKGGPPQFVCGDEGGEFARADYWHMLLPYIEDLVLVCGTLRQGPLPVLDDDPFPTSPSPQAPEGA